MKAKEYLPYDSLPKIKLGKSNIKKKYKSFSNKKEKEKNMGLFANRDIDQDEPVVTYWGDSISDDEIYHLYTQRRSEYQKIFPYIRNNDGCLAINGEKALTEKNPNLWGVFVNDISTISPEFLNNRNKLLNNIIKYLKTEIKCNLYVKNTDDFPVYYAKRKIYKGEELYIHYGIGYWLNHYDFKPEEIYEINEKVKLMI